MKSFTPGYCVYTKVPVLAEGKFISWVLYKETFPFYRAYKSISRTANFSPLNFILLFLTMHASLKFLTLLALPFVALVANASPTRATRVDMG